MYYIKEDVGYVITDLPPLIWCFCLCSSPYSTEIPYTIFSDFSLSNLLPASLGH